MIIPDSYTTKAFTKMIICTKNMTKALRNKLLPEIIRKAQVI